MSKSAPDATAAESAVSTSVLGVGFEALRQRQTEAGENRRRMTKRRRMAGSTEQGTT